MSGPAPPPGPAAPAQPPVPTTAPLPSIPAGYGAAPPPVGGRTGWMSRRLVIVLAILAVLVGVAVVAASLASHSSRLPLVSSSSTDGTFSAGDCVSLSSTRVTKTDCGGAHDAQIIEVVHSKQMCPSDTQEFDVNDGTGNLCLDTGNNSKG
jgi:hypothetical protein